MGQNSDAGTALPFRRGVFAILAFAITCGCDVAPKQNLGLPAVQTGTTEAVQSPPQAMPGIQGPPQLFDDPAKQAIFAAWFSVYTNVFTPAWRWTEASLAGGGKIWLKPLSIGPSAGDYATPDKSRVIKFDEFATESRRLYDQAAFGSFHAGVATDRHGANIPPATDLLLAVPAGQPSKAMMTVWDIKEVRYGPGFEFKVIEGRSLTKGEEVHVLQAEGEWALVARTPGSNRGEGWISSYALFNPAEENRYQNLHAVERLLGTAFVKSLDPSSHVVVVNDYCWERDNYEARLGKVRILGTYLQEKHGGSGLRIQIRRASDSKKLTEYGSASGYREL